MLGSLTEDQVAKYTQDGYLFPIDVFSKTQAADFRAQLESVDLSTSTTSRFRFKVLISRRGATSQWATLDIAAEAAFQLTNAALTETLATVPAGQDKSMKQLLRDVGILANTYPNVLVKDNQ